MEITSSIVVGIIVILIIGIYVFLLKSRENIKKLWKELEDNLETRYLLVEDLAKTVEKYVISGPEISDRIKMYMRAQKNTNNRIKKMQIERQIRGELKSVILIAKAYPELLISQNYKNIINELRETDEKIVKSGKKYNQFVKKYNKIIHTFPINMLSQRLGYDDEIKFNFK